jgi:TolB-like protein
VIQAGFSLEALRPTLAVIPFDARHAAPEHHVLGEVLAEEMIRELSEPDLMQVDDRVSRPPGHAGRDQRPSERGLRPVRTSLAR